MISKGNLKPLLQSLGFVEQGGAFRKTVNGYPLAVDFAREKIEYPERAGLTVNERQTCNFSSAENFVVLECVHRLLEKGYKAKRLELEPKWKVGRGASGGRADILVKDNAGAPFLLVECKTAGREFERAWAKTKMDGDQLFSYAQQISDVQFLCLYAADWTDGGLARAANIIRHSDNRQYLEHNRNLKSFANARDVQQRFLVWRDTYELFYETSGIFEDNAELYQVGKEKRALADLSVLSAAEQKKKYHEFATILRQHNVSGRENAFDVLINLFLCKLVDETQYPDALKFYWKGIAYDSPFDLLDRLQQLYKLGMSEFLGEEITYISKEDVRRGLRFIAKKPDATERAIWDLFVQQKFFTNNDFSFLDVHNEKLFYQNNKILLKVLEMWQRVRLTNENGNHHFLGDMFEGFLDQGIKQSEGQFLTPLPVCRFIVGGLPLENFANNGKPPLVMDYACGAGHFLNEFARQMEPLATAAGKNTAKFHKSVFGIEKEYRLSKVAKVSAFLYGQKDINICYGDGLVHSHAAFPQIKNNRFDVLAANPPYSVRGFLATLPQEQREKYALTGTINDLETNNSIETFFVERAKQLLKSGGAAGVIFPSSILTNGDNTYTKTREIILQFFDIVAIAEMGGGTFGKTGTNTVVLFLRRKATKPDTAEHWRERVGAWFDNTDDNQPVYDDRQLIKNYCRHIGAELTEYEKILRGKLSDKLLAHDIFLQYKESFDGGADIKALKKQRSFIAKNEKEQTAELQNRLLQFVQRREIDKLHHFILAAGQKNPVLVVKSPADTQARKNFLGYEWSGRKGDEGMKEFADSPLSDKNGRDNPQKLCRLIRDNFNGELNEIPEVLREYAATVDLADLLDFSRVDFDKVISLTPKKAAEVNSKYPLVKLGEVAEIKKGTSITKSKTRNGDIKVVAGGVGFAYLHDTANRDANTITVSGSGANAGYVNFWNEKIFASDCSTVRGKTTTHTKYIFHVLQSRQDEIFSLARGAAQPHVYPGDIARILIPNPPPEVWQKIADECNGVDSSVAAADAVIAKLKERIEKKMETVDGKHLAVKLGKLITSSQYGYTAKAADDGEVRYLRITDITEDGKLKQGGKYINPSDETKENYLLHDGDIVIARSGSTGRMLIYKNIGVPLVFASYLVRIKTDKNLLLPEYLFQYGATDSYWGQVKALTTTLAQPNMNAEKMKQIIVPLPSLDAQKRLVADIAEIEKTIAAARQTIAAAPAKKRDILQKHIYATD